MSSITAGCVGSDYIVKFEYMNIQIIEYMDIMIQKPGNQLKSEQKYL